MGILEDLQRLKDAEEFFEYFRIEYDENILKPYRLHILKKFNLYIRDEWENLQKMEDTTLYEVLRDYLRKSYETFLNSTPVKERLFKVHREAVSFIKLENKKP